MVKFWSGMSVALTSLGVCLLALTWFLTPGTALSLTKLLPPTEACDMNANCNQPDRQGITCQAKSDLSGCSSTSSTLCKGNGRQYNCSSCQCTPVWTDRYHTAVSSCVCKLGNASR